MRVRNGVKVFGFEMRQNDFVSCEVTEVKCRR